jgi:predicted nucleotidyltransferase component of viral defense system
LFDTVKISVAEIMEQRRYAGLQIKIPASLGTMRQIMKIDIGFGDVVTPSPSMMTSPTLLDMDAPEIKAYSPETVIAEKFEAMIDLAESNSRMKDFYDVYQLLSKHRFDAETLQMAVKQTFKNRKTALQRNHPLFESSFADNPDRNQLWERFIQRSKLDESVSFQEAMRVIRVFLMPKE